MRSLRARAAADPLGGVGVLGSVLLHASVAGGVLLGARRPPARPLLPAYRVELVAAPRPAGAPDAPAQPAPPEAAPPPTPARPQPSRPSAGTPPAPVRREPAPGASAARPSRPTVAGAPARPDPTPAPPARGADAPAPAGPTGTGGTGADPATIRTEGVEFPFPGYLRNLVSQVYRRWRPPAGNSALEAEVFFFVRRDGTVSGLQFIRRSGSFAFDLEAQGAVEAAARAAAFGALPPGYGPDVLPVSFFFSPRALR